MPDRTYQDGRAPAIFAVEALSAQGIRAFAYFGDPSGLTWTVQRGRNFKDALPVGSTFSAYDGGNPGDGRHWPEFVKWVGALPRPCGCLLATDFLAMPFYAAAREAKRKIGKDLMVIGVDDDQLICESAKPTLSSIRMDYFQEGLNAIALLKRRVENPTAPVKVMSYGAIGLVRRSSTQSPYTDHRLRRGMEFIDAHGCEAIGLNEVAAAMECSRRLAESIFRRETEATILDAIRSRRMKRVMELLKQPSFPIDGIPAECGYAASPAALKNYFKTETGMTMRDWRKQHLR